MKRWLLLLMMALVLPFALIACGGDDDDDNGDDDNGGGSSGPAFSESIGANGSVVYYPDNWTSEATEDGTIIVGSNQETVNIIAAEDSNPTDTPEGESFAMFVVLPAELMAMPDDSGSVTPEMVLDFLTSDMDGVEEVGPTETLTINGNPAVRASMTGGPVAGEIVVRQEPGLFAVIIYGANGNFNEQRDTLRNIARDAEAGLPE